jgi:proteic killer suppression protein
VIVSFSHKGLRDLYERGSRRGVPARQVPKLRRILTVLDRARAPEDLQGPAGWRVHDLKGDRAGDWSITVTGNWRITFRFTDDQNVELVDYEDYH